jgi:hypothetical protein
MDTTGLFPAAAAYFERMARDRTADVVELFASTARVVDDGRTYLGHSQIAEWLGGPASEFTTTSTRLGLETSGRATVIRVRLEGNFPGGCVDLSYEFVESVGGMIESLSIIA